MLVRVDPLGYLNLELNFQFSFNILIEQNHLNMLRNVNLVKIHKLLLFQTFSRYERCMSQRYEINYEEYHLLGYDAV
jgi:hypothetical protein